MGGTGTGKTTIINELINFIPEESTLAIIQNLPEIQSNRKHVVHFEQESELFGGTIAFLSAQERPHYFAVDEARDSGFFELAMGMGDRNKTILMGMYGRSPGEAIKHFSKQAVEQNKFLNTKLEIKKSIGKGLDLIVFVERLSDGSRKASITKVIDYKQGTDEFVLKEKE